MTARVLLFSIAISTLSAQTAPPVPAAYQDLYTQLSGQISAFNTTVNAAWNGQPYPVLNSAQLRSAACEQGTQLLSPSYYNVVLAEMQSLQALGIKTMTMHIDFPTLYPAYYANPSDYQSYLNFYLKLVADIRARGLKLVVENGVVFPQPGISSMDASAFYKTLSWPQYEQARAQQAATIAQQLHPDYLTVITEPDTESGAAAQPNADTASGSTDMLNQMLAAIQIAHVTDVKVGAGCGTWQTNFQDFANGYASTAVQFLDMHIYPVNRTYLANAITIAQIAQAAGKQVGLSEVWLYKERDSELGVLSSNTLFARDPFSFWQPLDQAFLQAIVNFAQYKQLAFISPFWTLYFHSYLDFATYGTMPSSQVLSQATTAAGNAMNAAQFTPTAAAYENMFVKPADTIPPTAPTGFSSSVTTSQIILNWTASTDNIGLAGYNVYRNGVLLNTTAKTMYQDLNLPPSTSYNYSVSAFDVMKNTSPQVPFTAATHALPDTQPPSVPTGLITRGLTSTQLNLAWSPSTDNVGVAGYKIYRGTSANSLSLYATSPSSSFNDANCSPTAGYYYAVAAYDAAGNASSLSAVVSGRSLPDTTPPTVPARLAPTSVTSSNVKLSWAASTDDVMVAGYQIYRGSSPSSLQLIAVVPSIPYSDSKVSTKKSYYYAVAAQDSSKNLSAKTTPILVTTP